MLPHSDPIPDPLSLLKEALSAWQAGDLTQAEIAIGQSLALNPNRPDAWTLKGIIHKRFGQTAEAISAYQRAVTLAPEYAEAYFNLGNLFREQQDWDHAVAHYRQAVTLRPTQAGWWMLLGEILRCANRPDEAILALAEALILDPTLTDAWKQKGNLHLSQNDPVSAIDCYHQVLKTHPNSLEIYHNLSIATSQAGRHQEAADCYRRLLPHTTDIQVLFQYAITCHKIGDLAEAEIYYQQIIERDPTHHIARWNRALGLLLGGHLEEGFREYECRYDDNAPYPPRSFGRIRWNGEEFLERCILVFSEQGFGDTLQMLRYLPWVIARGGKVILETTPPLRRLVEGIPGLHQIVMPGDPMPKIDLEVSLMSLPRIFGTKLDTIPNEVPYLQVSEVLETYWQVQLAPYPGPRIGLVWAGKPSHLLDSARSPRLGAFLPLIRYTEATFILLQKGPGRRDLCNIALPFHCVDITTNIRDFADTAAILRHLDLLITVDTSMAHLAGAMGCPVWVLVHYEPDWRWMLHREDSPWYPTMRLFRQPHRGRWDIVIDTISEELGFFCENLTSV